MRRRGEERLGERRWGDGGCRAGPWWGRVSAGRGDQGDVGPPPAAGSEPSLPGPGPTRTLQTLTDPGGTEGWAPSRPEDRIDKGEMLRRWAVWLGRGERAVHRAPSPASCGGPQLIPNRGLPGGARRKDRWEREESRFGASVTRRVELLFTEMGVMGLGWKVRGLLLNLLLCI